MKNIVLCFVFVASFLTACKKDRTKDANLFMSGRLMVNCYDSVPMANYPLRLFRTFQGGLSGQDAYTVGRDTTDSNGYFKIYFPEDHHAYWMYLQGSQGGEFMERIYPTQNYENINVFASHPANVKIRLNIINQRNLGDTLVLKDLNNYGQSIKIPFPIQNGYTYTAYDYTGLEQMGLENTKLFMNWGFIPSTGFFYDTTFYITQYCGGMNEFTINIK